MQLILTPFLVLAAVESFRRLGTKSLFGSRGTWTSTRHAPGALTVPNWQRAHRRLGADSEVAVSSGHSLTLSTILVISIGIVRPVSKMLFGCEAASLVRKSLFM